MQVGAGGHHSQKKPALSIHGVKENARDGYLWQHLCSGARNLCWVAGLAVRQQFGPAQGRLRSEISVCLWLRGFPGGSEVKASACNAGDWVGKIPRRRKWQPTPVFLLGESQGRRTLVGYSPWGHNESDMTERLQLWLIHVEVWQKTEFCKAIILQ